MAKLTDLNVEAVEEEEFSIGDMVKIHKLDNVPAMIVDGFSEDEGDVKAYCMYVCEDIVAHVWVSLSNLVKVE